MENVSATTVCTVVAVLMDQSKTRPMAITAGRVSVLRASWIRYVGLNEKREIPAPFLTRVKAMIEKEIYRIGVSSSAVVPIIALMRRTPAEELSSF